MKTATKIAIPAAVFAVLGAALGFLKYLTLPDSSAWEWDVDPDEF